MTGAVKVKVLLVGETLNLLSELTGFIEYLRDKLGIDVEIHGFTVSKSVEDIEEKKFLNIEKLYVGIAEKAFPDQIAEAVYRVFTGENYDLIVAVATKTGNDVLARVSEKVNAPMHTEILDLEFKNGELLFHRAILGGRAISVEKSVLPAAITIPAKKYEPTQTGEVREVVKVELPPSKYRIVEVKEKTRGAVNIEEAEVVVGVGRGFKKREDLKIAEEIAKLLNGALGCSRPIAADYGWLPEDSWIGISGKKIRPKLYMPVGISGAPQHMTAAMDAKVIVAVNKDKNAPVFQYADYGVVADLYKFLPVLAEKLKEKLSKS